MEKQQHSISSQRKSLVIKFSTTQPTKKLYSVTRQGDFSEENQLFDDIEDSNNNKKLDNSTPNLNEEEESTDPNTEVEGLYMSPPSSFPAPQDYEDPTPKVVESEQSNSKRKKPSSLLKRLSDCTKLRFKRPNLKKIKLPSPPPSDIRSPEPTATEPFINPEKVVSVTVSQILTQIPSGSLCGEISFSFGSDNSVIVKFNNLTKS